ncbi:MAG: 1,2-phenylacetyl-CoA epoxidase subunit B [bacterium]|nr:1,2-phenylacetyl-CoA epoxidase subunit B [bacterium]
MEGDDKIQFGSHREGGWPRWEAFVRQRGGLAHIHSESVHAPDAETALLNARDAYLRRVEGVSLWVAPADQVTRWESDAPEAASKDIAPRPSALWEVFVRHRRGLAHAHAGSMAATGPYDAIEKARRVYVTHEEGVGVWVVSAATVVAADPEEAEALFEPFADKDYRYPTYYEIPDEVGHM